MILHFLPNTSTLTLNLCYIPFHIYILTHPVFSIHTVVSVHPPLLQYSHPHTQHTRSSNLLLGWWQRAVVLGPYPRKVSGNSETKFETISELSEEKIGLQTCVFFGKILYCAGTTHANQSLHKKNKNKAIKMWRWPLLKQSIFSTFVSTLSQM